jgi:hypothetical protein
VISAASQPLVLGYVTLWACTLLVIIIDPSMTMSPWIAPLWLVVVFLWAGGSRVAQIILLIGALWTSVGVLILEPSSGPDFPALLIAGLAIMQACVLVIAAIRNRGGEKPALH